MMWRQGKLYSVGAMKRAGGYWEVGIEFDSPFGKGTVMCHGHGIRLKDAVKMAVGVYKLMLELNKDDKPREEFVSYKGWGRAR